MTTRMKLELIVDIDLDGVDESIIRDNLSYIVNNAMNNGLVTGDTEATVENWTHKTEVID